MSPKIPKNHPPAAPPMIEHTGLWPLGSVFPTASPLPYV